MKRPAVLLVVLTVVGGLAYVAYRVAWPTEDRRIRSTLDALAGLASTPQQEGDLLRLARIQRIGDYLLEEVLVEVEDGPVMGGRQAIVGALVQASAVGPVGVHFADVTVRMGPDQRTAAVTATVEVERPDPRLGGTEVDAREVEMTWVRQESSWMMAKARVVRPLK